MAADKTDLTDKTLQDAHPTPPMEVKSVLSVLSAGGLALQADGHTTVVPATVLQFTPPPAEPNRADGDPFRHGRSINGTPLTWTGRIVSLDEWRRLPEWERHGSTGRVWNGLTRQWEPDGGAA